MSLETPKMRCTRRGQEKTGKGQFLSELSREQLRFLLSATLLWHVSL